MGESATGTRQLLTMSATTSPQKEKANAAGWVKFEDTDEVQDSGGIGSPSKAHIDSPSRSSSGVSSARGSVTSAALPNQEDENDGGILAVSEVQVVDEHTLKREQSIAAGGGGGTSGGPLFKQMSTTTPKANGASETEMDNVNLNDTTSPHKTTNAARGRTFENGDIIVTLLPVNEKLPWISPAKFRPELVPEELMAPVLTLTVEDYVQTLEKLTSDMRFTIYIMGYKRILVIWIVLAFVILLSLLFSGFQGIELFACGVVWLILNAGAIFFCMWIKIKLNKQMEKCMAVVNNSLMKHKLLLGVDDRGKISCHKVNLCFIYFDSSECIKRLETILAEKPEENNGETPGFDREDYLRNVEEFEDIEIVVGGRNTARIERGQERAEKLYLHYIQRWAKDFLRRRLDWVIEDLYGTSEYASNTSPRHLRSALCPCQYIEEHLRNKRLRESLNPCAVSSNPCHWCD